MPCSAYFPVSFCVTYLLNGCHTSQYADDTTPYSANKTNEQEK